MGTRPDFKRRLALVRLNSKAYQYKIATTCSFIYEKGYGVKSKAVEALLKAESLTPTIVMLYLYTT
jgi:hypothetical protein